MINDTDALLDIVWCDNPPEYTGWDTCVVNTVLTTLGLDPEAPWGTAKLIIERGKQALLLEKYAAKAELHSFTPDLIHERTFHCKCGWSSTPSTAGNIVDEMEEHWNEA